MTITNFGTLKTAIADTLNRDDLASAVPTFVKLAEARFNRELRTWKQETRSTATLDVQYSALPTDFLQPIRLQILDSQTGEISPISTAQMLQLRGDNFNEAGRPVHYAITAQGLELLPTPDSAYSASLVYYAKITALSADGDTNWLLTDAPDAYLYGALVHSAPYLKDDARLQVWEALLAQGINNLNTSSSEAKYGGSGLVMRTRR
jgi:hypothetical protein